MVSTRLPKPELWAISLLLSVVIIAVVYYVRILFKHCLYYFKDFFLSKNRGPYILYKKEEHGSSCFAKFFLARNRFLLSSLFSLLKNFFSFKIGNTIFCISKIRIKIKLLLYSVFQEFFFVLLKTTVLPPGGSLQLYSPYFVMCLACHTTWYDTKVRHP